MPVSPVSSTAIDVLRRAIEIARARAARRRSCATKPIGLRRRLDRGRAARRAGATTVAASSSSSGDDVVGAREHGGRGVRRDRSARVDDPEPRRLRRTRRRLARRSYERGARRARGSRCECRRASSARCCDGEAATEPSDADAHVRIVLRESVIEYGSDAIGAPCDSQDLARARRDALTEGDLERRRRMDALHHVPLIAWAVGGAAIVLLVLAAARRRRDRRTGVRARRPALRPRAAAGPASSRSPAKPAIRRACCRRAGTSRCGVEVQGRARSAGRGRARSDRARRREGRRAIPSERVLGREVDCDNFQDAVALPRRTAARRAVSSRCSPRASTASTRRCSTSSPRARAQRFGLSPSSSYVFRVPSDRVGIVTALDGRPIASGDLAGPSVPEPRQLPARARRSSRPAAAAVCRRRCCCPARGT